MMNQDECPFCTKHASTIQKKILQNQPHDQRPILKDSAKILFTNGPGHPKPVSSWQEHIPCCTTVHNIPPPCGCCRTGSEHHACHSSRSVSRYWGPRNTEEGVVRSIIHR